MSDLLPPGESVLPPALTDATTDALTASPDSDKQPKGSIVAASAGAVAEQVRVARFRGRPMVMIRDPYPHYTPLHKEQFDRIGYPILGGVSRSRMSDVFAYLGNTAEDLTANDHYILFGVPLSDVDVQADTDIEFLHANKPVIWDTDALAFVPSMHPDETVWRSPYARVVPEEYAPVEFVMQLAGGNQGKYDDIMQSLAPLVMARKPDGVIWWVGDGANGKSTLMDAIWRIFPGQLSSITVKRLVDGRDTPSLNGTLANVVKESSEGRIEDTEIYKAIGTHEDFRVHKFHSQDDITIRGNLHHIFSANSIPTFNDKGFSARRRTFIVPFSERFQSDPEFEDKTFTPDMFGQLINEMCRYAIKLREQGYRYKWSADTLAAKLEYDTDANNAEEYAKYLIDEGVVGFDSYHPLKVDYENWCADNGYVPLGITNLRRAVGAVGFERMTIRMGEANVHSYRIPTARDSNLNPLGMGRPGLFTLPGFQQPAKEMVVPDFTQPAEEEPEPEELPKKKSILDGRW